MSVINNVLKDLENRSSQFTPIDIASVQNLSAKKPKQVVSLAFILSLVLLVAAISLGLYLFQQEMLATDKQSELATIAPAPLTQMPAPAVKAALPANQIIDLQIRESIDDMNLEFSLSGRVVSYLKERSENSFVYHLKNIQSEIIAPVMSKNRWIDEFSLSKNNQGIDVSFRTAANVLVETRQDLEGDKQLWAIKLKKVATPASVASEVETHVEKPAKIPKAEESRIEVAEPETTPKIKDLVEAPFENKVVKLEITSTQEKLSSSEQLNRARVLIKKRRWNEAEAQLLVLIDGPQDLAARTLLLSIYQQGQRTDSFSVLIDESIILYPQQALFKTEFARSLFQSKAYSKVIDFLTAEKDASAPQLALLAASYQRLDQHLQALDYYQQSLGKDASQTKNWIGLAISQEQATQYEAALRSYSMAARIGSLNSKLQAFVDNKIKQLTQVLN